MNSFAFLMVATSLCVTFLPATNGLTCYSCSWDNSTCNALEKKSSDLNTVTCGAAEGGTTVAGATEAPTAAPAKRYITEPAGDVLYRAVRSKPFLSKMADAAATFHCYKVLVKANNTITVGRGCKATASTDDCLKLDGAVGTVDECVTCEKDNCNSGLSLSSDGLLIHCALLLATGIAKMFFQTK